jgi:hypothetical protein
MHERRYRAENGEGRGRELRRVRRAVRESRAHRKGSTLNGNGIAASPAFPLPLPSRSMGEQKAKVNMEKNNPSEHFQMSTCAKGFVSRRGTLIHLIADLIRWGRGLS